jgi:basic membrane protein A
LFDNRKGVKFYMGSYSRRQFFWYSSAALSTSLFLKACTNNSSSTATQAEPFKVAAVLTGVITDQSWNQTAYEGINAAKQKLGFRFDYVERTSTPDEAEVLADFARQGYNVVIGHGGEFSSPVQQVASQFPNTFFVVTNGGVSSSNVASVQINNLQSGYVSGVIAGLTTKTNQLAFITAKSVRATDQLARSFALGAQAVKPDAKVSVSYTGDWDDVAKAKEAALALISAKADVLYMSLDNAFLGVLQAATEQEVYAVGNFVDRLDAAPKAVLTSTVQKFGTALSNVIELAINKQLEGKVYVIGLENPDVLYLGRFGEMVPKEVQQQVVKTVDELKARAIAFADCKVNGKDSWCVKSTSTT